MGRVRARKRTAPPTDRSLLPVPHPNARATAHSHCKTAIWVLFCTTTPPGHLFSCLEITGTPHNTPRVAIVRRCNDFDAKSASFNQKNTPKYPTYQPLLSQPAPLASFFLLLSLPSLLSSSLSSPIPSFFFSLYLISFLPLSFSLISSPPFLLLSSKSLFPS